MNRSKSSGFPSSQEECDSFYGNSTTGGVSCPAIWDSFHCWPPTSSGQLVTELCLDIFLHYDVRLRPDPAVATRVCGEDGRWDNKTDYAQCMGIVETSEVPVMVSYIMLVGSVVSLISLLVTLIIFSSYKSLQCCRLRVHKNLVVSLMFHSLFLLSLPLGVLLPNFHFRDIDWLCKTLLASTIYTATTSIYWMFVEGLVLYSSIAASVFRQKSPFFIYYIIGWGLPLVFVVSWVAAMCLHLPPARCWRGYGKSNYMWLITGPMILVLLINLCILVIIVRIIVTKVRASTSVESDQIRKAFKATVLLFPLLGISHLLFCINPQDSGYLEGLYMIANAILQSCQGTIVSILYCFLNSEVQTALCNTYRRLELTRGGTRRNHVAPRGGLRSYKNSLLTTDVTELEDLRLSK